MRHYPEDDSDRADLEKMGAQDWQVECLKYNPRYVWWGIHEDYMAGRDGATGWDQPVSFESWSQFDWSLNELNELVNFYFFVDRDHKECHACEGSGYNAPTKKIADDFYADGNKARAWYDKITQDEVQALWDEHRLFEFNPRWKENKGNDGIPAPSADEVNRWAKTGMGHDSINRFILVRARAQRLGVYGDCPLCGGSGYLWTETESHLGLALWILHPRKGCSRGVEIAHIDRDQLGAVFEYLDEGAARNADRFSKIPRDLNVIDGELGIRKPKLNGGQGDADSTHHSTAVVRRMDVAE